MFSYERIYTLPKGNLKQILILARHFFNRLFINDVVFFEEQMKEKIIAILAILAVISSYLSHRILFKYVWIADEGTSWVEKCYFLFFLMIIMGFIVVMEWDVIFLDSRDFSNLLPLPVKVRNLFIAKFSSLCLFIFLFFLGINSLSTIVFLFYLPKWQSPSVLFSLRFIASHLVSVLAAGFFIFFIFGLLIGILTSLFGYKIFNRVSLLLRSLLIIAFVFMMIFILVESTGKPPPFSHFQQFRESNSLFLYLFPPMWFTGLYETLLGNNDPLFSALSCFALLAFVIPPLVFYLTEVLSYRRYIIKMQEVKKRTAHFVRLKKFFLNLFNLVFLRNHIQRAVFYFFGKTLVRSMLHKIRVVSYMATSIAVILIILVSGSSSIQELSDVNKTLLSIPLVLSFFLLIGIRAVVNIPAASETNWVFKLTEGTYKKNYFSGLKKGIFFFMLLPLFVLLFLFYFFLWGWSIAFYHCLFGIIVSLLLMEILFIKYHKIPFVCSYLPGKAKLHLYWIIYFISFLIYAFLMSSVEYKILNSPLSLFIFYGVVLVIIVVLRVSQNRFIYKKLEILYEEMPEPAMVTLIPYD